MEDRRKELRQQQKEILGWQQCSSSIKQQVQTRAREVSVPGGMYPRLKWIKMDLRGNLMVDHAGKFVAELVVDKELSK